MASKADYKPLIRLAEEQGWRIEWTGDGHRKWFPPDGSRYVTTCNTPSDARSVLNDKARLRRAGLRLPRKDGRRD